MTRTNETKAYCIASSEVAAEEFDGEYVVLDLGTGRYFSFAGGAALVWAGLVAGATPSELAARLPAGSQARASFAAFVEGAINAGLLREAEREAERPADVDASDLAERIAAAGDTFAFEGFDDLTELLAADPIHDVAKEAGWPHSEPRDA